MSLFSSLLDGDTALFTVGLADETVTATVGVVVAAGVEVEGAAAAAAGRGDTGCAEATGVGGFGGLEGKHQHDIPVGSTTRAQHSTAQYHDNHATR